MSSTVLVREARSTDLEGLALVCYGDRPVVHSDRLQDAALGHLQYLVAESDGVLVGFGLLVFSRPATWPDAERTEGLPAILDLHVAKAVRGRGIGTAMIQQMEEIAARQGCDGLFLSVDPIENERAHALYVRLGFRALQAEPYRDHWRFVDSQGCVHEGQDWQIDMVKAL